MGLDFLRRTAKQHRKAWSNEFFQAADDLFAPSHATIHRSFLASIQPGSSLEENDPVSIRLVSIPLIGDCAVVFTDIFPLAIIDKPSLELTEILASQGILDGVVDEVNEFVRTASIFIGEKGGLDAR